MFNPSQISKSFAFILSVFIFSFSLSYLVFAWAEPSSTPPGGNASAPLNASSASQTKTGSLYLSTDSGSNAGVGTSSPNAKLGIYDSNDTLLRLLRSGTTSEYSFNLGTDGKLVLKDQTGNSRLSVDTAGNVGIGTASPGQKLSVAGTIESTSGGFKFPDGSTQITAAAGGRPGESIMYLRENQRRGSTPSCPAGWTQGGLGAISGPDSGNYYIMERACYRC